MPRFIEINEKNLPTITELNNGVAPTIEEPKTFYVEWWNDSFVNEIVTNLQVQTIERLMPRDMAIIQR